MQPTPSAPIVFGPRVYAQLRALSKRLGIKMVNSHVSMHNVLVIRLPDVGQVEKVADDAGIGVVEVGGRYSCALHVADQLTRFEALP